MKWIRQSFLVYRVQQRIVLLLGIAELMHVTHMEIEWLAHLESTNGRLAQAGVLSPKLLYISRAASYFYDTECEIFFWFWVGWQ